MGDGSRNIKSQSPQPLEKRTLEKQPDSPSKKTYDGTKSSTPEISANLPTEKFGISGKVAEMSYGIMGKNSKTGESSLQFQKDQGKLLDSTHHPQNTSESETSSPIEQARMIAERAKKMAEEAKKMQQMADKAHQLATTLEKSKRDLQAAKDSNNPSSALPHEVLQVVYDTDKYLWNEHMKSLRDHSETAETEPKNAWSDKDVNKVQALREWNKIQNTVDDIKRSKVYQHLSEEIPQHFEEQSKIFEDLHEGVLNGTVRWASLQEQTGETIQKQPNELGEAIKAFDTLNTTKEVVNFEQKVYDFTGMTSRNFSNAELDWRDANNIERRVTDVIKSHGWQDTINRTTEVIQQINTKNCENIVSTIWQLGQKYYHNITGTQWMTSSDAVIVARGLTGMLHNEQLAVDTRMKMANAIGELAWNLEDKSIAGELANELGGILSQSKKSESGQPLLHIDLEVAINKLNDQSKS